MSPHTGKAKENCTGVGFHESITCDTWVAADTAVSQVEHFLGHLNTAGLGAGAAKVNLHQTICSRPQTDSSTPQEDKESTL